MTRDQAKPDPNRRIWKRLLNRVRSSSDLRAGSGDPHAEAYTDGNGSNGEATAPADRSRTRTPPFKKPTFKAGSSTSSSPPPRGKKGSASSARPHPEAGLSRELWDEAYDSIRLDPSTMGLVVTYESIISQELPDDLKAAVHATLSPPDGNTDRRMELMTAIASAGLRKRRGSKASQVDDTSRIILQQSKCIVEGQLDDFPSAALAWPGFCTLTPLLIDPILRHEEFRRGMIHIIGRIPWYMHLTHLLQCPSWVDAEDFEARQHEFGYRRDRAKDVILRVYRRVLELEMNCVCATASAWNSVARHTVRWQGLGKLVDSILELDEQLHELVQDYVVEGSRRQQMLARNVDLDVETLEKTRSPEGEAGQAEEEAAGQAS